MPPNFKIMKGHFQTPQLKMIKSSDRQKISNKHKDLGNVNSYSGLHRLKNVENNFNSWPMAYNGRENFNSFSSMKDFSVIPTYLFKYFMILRSRQGIILYLFSLVLCQMSSTHRLLLCLMPKS